MSDQPPPPPYQPPGPPPGHGHYGEQRQGRSNKAKFWIGVALALPAVLAASVVTGLMGALGAVVDPDSGTVTGILVSVAGLAELGLLVAGIVWERTRWFALGVLAGVAVLTILAAGACVLLIVALTNSYN